MKSHVYGNNYVFAGIINTYLINDLQLFKAQIKSSGTVMEVAY